MAVVDGVFALNPYAKGLFMLATVPLSIIYLPAAAPVGIIGFVGKRVSRYGLVQANCAEPKPTLTKTTNFMRYIIG